MLLEHYLDALESRLQTPYHGSFNRHSYVSYTIPDTKVHLDLAVSVYERRVKEWEKPACYAVGDEIWVYYGQKQHLVP